ncbi:hypothetical protein KSS87_000399, partial [Heliosperma pusillum]
MAANQNRNTSTVYIASLYLSSTETKTTTSPTSSTNDSNVSVTFLKSLSSSAAFCRIKRDEQLGGIIMVLTK